MGLRFILKYVWQNKSIMRILYTQRVLQLWRPRGLWVDMGAGSLRYTYAQLLDDKDVSSRITCDIDPVKRPSLCCDLQGRIPMVSNCADTITSVSLMEHLFDYEGFLKESYRILKPGGTFYVFVPFLERVHGDPYDFHRWTPRAMTLTLEKFGFKSIAVESVGRGPFIAAYHLLGWAVPRLLRLLIVPLCLALDSFFGRLSPIANADVFSLGVIAECKK